MRGGRGCAECGAPGGRDRRPRGRQGETKTEQEKSEKGARIPRPHGASVLPRLTRRSHPSLSSGHHCPSPGAGVGEAGGGHRAPGLSVPRPLPLRSQPGLRCCPRCLGSGAAHHTGGRREGEIPKEASGKLPTLAPRRGPSLPPEPALPFSVSEPCQLWTSDVPWGWGGAEGPVPGSSLICLACEKCPLPDSRCVGRRVQRREMTQISGLRVRGQLM